jgi:hypothetical protein
VKDIVILLYNLHKDRKMLAYNYLAYMENNAAFIALEQKEEALVD